MCETAKGGLSAVATFTALLNQSAQLNYAMRVFIGHFMALSIRCVAA
jgi:hypothetical protein